jgi:hypothetical protein
VTGQLTGQPKRNPDTPEARPCAYQVIPAGYDDFANVDKSMWAVYVVDGGSEHGWSIRRGGVTSPVVLDGAFEWEFEGSPSSRTEDHLSTHRWPLDEALKRAMHTVDSVVLNGMTAAEASFRVKRRLEDARPS